MRSAVASGVRHCSGSKVSRIGANGRTPLHYAAHHGNHETIMALLAWTHNEIDVPDTDGGTTALMFAAGSGHVDAVNVLVAAGADVDAKDNRGLTARDYTMVYGMEHENDAATAIKVVQVLANADAIRQNAMKRKKEEL